MSMNNVNMRGLLEQAINEPVIKYSAGAVIMRIGDGNVQEILMIQRSKKDHWPLQWEFPRGGCDSDVDDNLRDCVKREVKEETGLDIKVGRLIDKHKYVTEGGKKITKCYNYLCKLEYPDQEIRLSHEHEKGGYKWISEVGEVELMASPEQKETIQKVLNDERSIVSYPKHQNTQESVDFYLQALEENENLEEFSFGGGAATASTMPVLFKLYIGALLIKLAIDTYKNHFTKAARECKGMPGGEKGICMLRAKIAAKQAALNKLTAGIRKCDKDRKPDSCREKVNAKINKLKTEIGYMNKRQKELRGAPITH
jgi:8-oxo-dGTP pyrophosphatase MutT (NUDIX family)